MQILSIVERVRSFLAGQPRATTRTHDAAGNSSTTVIGDSGARRQPGRRENLIRPPFHSKRESKRHCEPLWLHRGDGLTGDGDRRRSDGVLNRPRRTVRGASRRQVFFGCVGTYFLPGVLNFDLSDEVEEQDHG